MFWLMEFDFETILQPGKYHKAAGPIFRLLWKTLKEGNENTNVDDCVPAYCIVGHVIHPDTALLVNEDDVGPLPTFKKRRDVQAK